MKTGDLVRYGGIPGNPLFPGTVGVLLEKLQYDEDDFTAPIQWSGDPAWWIQFINDNRPTWSYEEELTLVTEGN